MAHHINRLWEEQGLTWVKMLPYTVTLSYPDKDNPNRIVLRNGRGEVMHTSQLMEKILRPEQNHSDVVPPFNAFSAPGTPQGQLMYVNYARMEDFLWLKDIKHINFNGKICIARYGKIFRGDKAKHAELFGGSGLIFFSDPKDYRAGGAKSVYPESWWLPGTGVQRGTVNDVDPLTPGYPGIDSAYYEPDGEKNLPKIPVHPIGYDDAKIFLEQLGGEEAPEDWRGALPITYRLGPGFQDPTWNIQMFISTHNETRITYNVFGSIVRDIEPDRYVLIGNHYDAWVFGAVDPSSGTASMLELSRMVGKLAKEGWRPRRTILFCAWGAEEEGIIGSREWVENFGHIIGNRVVAYLNVDIAVQGNFTFRGLALPMLFKALYEATKQVPNPNQAEIAKGRKTVYDTWAIGMPQKDANGKPTAKPWISLLGSGSDFAPFIKKVGVSCADLRYHFDDKLGISSYPLYHSVYETFHLVDKIMDPTFAVWAELARNLADSYILPFDVESFATAIDSYSLFVEFKHGSLMRDHGLAKRLEYLRLAVAQFRSAADQFQKRVESVDRQNPMAVRQLNDQMMQLERAFIDPLGLPGRALTRNVLFAPSQQNTNAGSSFPGLNDALFEISRDPDQQTRWREVSKQLAIVTFFIETAATYLHKPTDF
ncbi:Glutamate carboxypeptidase 2 [Lamellibrachia satsuma]|nr:Glutamate carboxypeptidase 2 [Lamellibrachia satsuma]